MQSSLQGRPSVWVANGRALFVVLWRVYPRFGHFGKNRVVPNRRLLDEVLSQIRIGFLLFEGKEVREVQLLESAEEEKERTSGDSSERPQVQHPRPALAELQNEQREFHKKEHGQAHCQHFTD